MIPSSSSSSAYGDSSIRGNWEILSTFLRLLPAVPGTRVALLRLPLNAADVGGVPLPDCDEGRRAIASSGTAVPTLPSASGSRMLNCAIVRILRDTHEARILPRCFSPRRERGKSPLETKATMSRTSWCSFRTVLTITGTMEARKERVRDSAIRTRREPAWKMALEGVLG